MIKQPKTILIATLIGYGGLAIWSLSPLLVSYLQNIPTFEILAVTLSISFLVIATKLTIKKQWSLVKQPWFIWLIGVIGIYGNDLTYVAAFKYAPPVQVDLINYLWPILVILGSGLLPKEKFTYQHLGAGLLGLAGFYILITHGTGLSGIEMSHMPGYLLALLDAFIWATYTLLARYHGKTPVEMVGMYCGVGALLSFIFHCQVETTILPSMQQVLIMLGLGVSTSGAAYFLWEYGVKRGNFKLLSILSYGNPILSVLLLVLCKKAELSPALDIACLLVMGGAVVGSINWQHVRRKMIAAYAGSHNKLYQHWFYLQAR